MLNAADVTWASVSVVARSVYPFSSTLIRKFSPPVQVATPEDVASCLVPSSAALPGLFSIASVMVSGPALATVLLHWS